MTAWGFKPSVMICQKTKKICLKCIQSLTDKGRKFWFGIWVFIALSYMTPTIIHCLFRWTVIIIINYYIVSLTINFSALFQFITFVNLLQVWTAVYRTVFFIAEQFANCKKINLLEVINIAFKIKLTRGIRPVLYNIKVMIMLNEFWGVLRFQFIIQFIEFLLFHFSSDRLRKALIVWPKTN
jgi:hypothetical protein